MRNKHPKAFQFLLSAALAIGTITGAAPIMAQEDTPFDDTVSAEEFAEAYSEETVEDDIALESGEVDEIVMDEQTIGADDTFAESAKVESADEIIKKARREEDMRARMLTDEGTAGITNQKVPSGTPLWKDDRVRVSNTRQFPNYAICQIYAVYQTNTGEERVYANTGFFISPTEILTDAANIYQHDKGMGYATRLVIDRGSDANGIYFERIDSDTSTISSNVPYAFINESNEQKRMEMDYAILKVSKPVLQNGYIRLSSAAGRDARVRMIGYPDHARGDYSGENQYEDWSTKTKAEGRLLESDVTGSFGQYGAPVLTADNQAVALYSYDYINGFNNQVQWSGGIRFTLDILNAIDSSFSGKNTVESPVYRCYNPNSGEHVYTMNYKEVKNLVRVGWAYEGLSWRNEDQAGRTPVYRLYNPNAGDHHYTTNVNEYNGLRKLGWRGEGVMWYAPKDTRNYNTVYRLYNPNAKKAGAHHFTTSLGEYNALVRAGWKGEGKAFNAR